MLDIRISSLLLKRTLKKSWLIGIGAMSPIGIKFAASIYCTPVILVFMLLSFWIFIPFCLLILSISILYFIEFFIVSRSERIAKWIAPRSLGKFIFLQILLYSINFVLACSLFFAVSCIWSDLKNDLMSIILPALCSLPFFVFFLWNSCADFKRIERRKSLKLTKDKRFFRAFVYGMFFIVCGVALFPYTAGTDWEHTRNMYVYGHPEPVDYIGRKAEDIIAIYNVQNRKDLDEKFFEQFSTPEGYRIEIDFTSLYGGRMQFVLNIKDGVVTEQWLDRYSDGFDMFDIFKGRKWDYPPSRY